MLFNFGTEICVFSKICKWWRWGGGGTLRRRCCVSSFLNCYFSDRIYQNGVRHSFNFHFSLLISKKRSKNGVKPLVWMIAQQGMVVVAVVDTNDSAVSPDHNLPETGWAQNCSG